MEGKLKAARGVNLAAGILDIIKGAWSFVLLIFIVLGIAGVSSSIGDLVGAGYGQVGEYAGLLVTFILTALIFAADVACLLGFGIATICYGKSKDKVYCNKKGAFLAFAIIETIGLFFLIIITAVSISVIYLTTLIISIAIMILRWIGYAFVKQVADVREAKGTLEEAKEAEKPAEEEVNIDKLQKLVELKNSGMISEEEYEILKKKELGL